MFDNMDAPPGIKSDNTPSNKRQVIYIIIVAILAVTGLVLAELAFFVKRPSSPCAIAHNEACVTNEILRLLGEWDKAATLYESLFVYLSVIALSCSICAASMAGDQTKKNAVRYFSIIAAILFASMSASNLGQKSKDIRNAYRHLNAALMTYQGSRDTSKNSIDKLIDAYKESETMIGSIEFNSSNDMQSSKINRH